MRQKRGLPAPEATFCNKKAGILHHLALPDIEYSDASPKGSVDAGIRHLIDVINRAEGFVTTSSCAGRVTVFLEGRRSTAPDEGDEQQTAGVGGKGAGGTWLFVSHEPVPRDGRACWLDALKASQSAADDGVCPLDEERRWIRFKFEPMILHVLTASTVHAQVLIRAGLQAGFRESGAVSLTPPTDTQSATPMVAIRSLGLGLESLLGYETPQGRRRWLVSADLVEALCTVANERFAENTRRIERFRAAFLDAVETPEMTPGRVWEDAVARRERKRAEGLRRKAALAAKRTDPSAMDGGLAVEPATKPDPT